MDPETIKALEIFRDGGWCHASRIEGGTEVIRKRQRTFVSERVLKSLIEQNFITLGKRWSGRAEIDVYVVRS